MEAPVKRVRVLREVICVKLIKIAEFFFVSIRVSHPIRSNPPFTHIIISFFWNSGTGLSVNPEGAAIGGIAPLKKKPGKDGSGPSFRVLILNGYLKNTDGLRRKD
jgi:hypothetical protein